MTATRVSDQQILLLHIYDSYRNALLSKKYAAARLMRVRRLSRAIEIILALATPGAVGGWAFWHASVTGERIWSLVAAAVLILTVVKPLMNWQSELERRTGLHMDFTRLYYDMDHLVIQISSEKGVSVDAEKRFFDALGRYAKIAANEDPVRSERLVRRYKAEVEREIPAQKLWTPPGDETNRTLPSLPN
jgi:hypothetical protein